MQLIAFDLDGTLCNTIEDIAGSLNRALEKHGIDPYPLSVVQGMVGRSVAYMCQRAMPHGRENDWKPVMDSFFEDYTHHSLDHTRPYPGVAEALRALKEKGYLLAVVTNKPHAHAVHMISELFPPHGNLFCQVQGQNSKFTLKPHPASLQFVLDMQKVKNANALYVGDSEVDFQFARNGGLHFCGVSWGFKGRSFLENLGSEFVIDEPRELVAVMEKLEGSR